VFICETTPTGCPRSRPRVSLSIYLSIYLCFTPAGEPRQVLEDTSWRSPFGCAVDARGNLHVVDTPALKVRILQPVA